MQVFFSIKKNLFKLLALTTVQAYMLTLTSCVEPAPTSTPSLQFIKGGTTRLGPQYGQGEALGIVNKWRDEETRIGKYHIKFSNNVPYSVDIYVVREFYSGEEKPDATRIEDLFKDIVAHTSEQSGEIVVSTPFVNPPYHLWFQNNTTNTDSEIECEIYWEPL